LRKAIKAIIIIAIVLVAIFVIYPIVVVYYALNIMQDTFKTESKKAMIQYDLEHNTDYSKNLKY